MDNDIGKNELIWYPDNINLIIEKAYCNQDKEVRFKDDGGIEFIINFNNMTEYPTVDETDNTTVTRRVKINGFYDYYYYHVLVIKYHDDRKYKKIPRKSSSLLLLNITENQKLWSIRIKRKRFQVREDNAQINFSTPMICLNTY